MNQNKNQNFSLDKIHNHEYSIIKADLIKVAIINAIFFGLVMALYFYDKNTGILANLFNKFIN